MQGMNINFGGVDPQQIQQMQQNAQMCAEHPECNGCPMYTLNGYNGTICENAVIRLSQGGNSDESKTSDSTQEGTS